MLGTESGIVRRIETSRPGRRFRTPMNRTDRKRQAKVDEKQLAHGVDPESSDPALIAAMARQMLRLFETAKSEKNIDPAVKFFHAKVEATLKGSSIPVACGKGCAHCCHSWVSVIA